MKSELSIHKEASIFQKNFNAPAALLDSVNDIANQLHIFANRVIIWSIQLRSQIDSALEDNRSHGVSVEVSVGATPIDMNGLMIPYSGSFDSRKILNIPTLLMDQIRADAASKQQSVDAYLCDSVALGVQVINETQAQRRPEELPLGAPVKVGARNMFVILP